jgi:hypothetical protein
VQAGAAAAAASSSSSSRRLVAVVVVVVRRPRCSQRRCSRAVVCRRSWWHSLTGGEQHTTQRVCLQPFACLYSPGGAACLTGLGHHPKAPVAAIDRVTSQHHAMFAKCWVLVCTQHQVYHAPHPSFCVQTETPAAVWCLSCLVPAAVPPACVCSGAPSASTTWACPLASPSSCTTSGTVPGSAPCTCARVPVTPRGNTPLCCCGRWCTPRWRGRPGWTPLWPTLG